MMQPLSLAKYPYVHGNPVNAIDPSGMFKEDSLGALAVVAELSKITVPLVFSLPIIGGAIVIGGVAGVAVTAGVPGVVNVAKTAISIGARIGVQVARRMAEILTLVDDILTLQGFPVIVWGNELPTTTIHTFDALHGISNGFKYEGGRASPFLGRISRPGWGRQWLPGTGRCPDPDTSVGDGLTCDEYPYNSTVPGGWLFYELNQVSLRPVPDYEQLIGKRNPQTGATSQGTKLGQFYTQAGVEALDPVNMWFGVGVTARTESFWIDRSGQPQQFR